MKKSDILYKLHGIQKALQFDCPETASKEVNNLIIRLESGVLVEN